MYNNKILKLFNPYLGSFAIRQLKKCSRILNWLEPVSSRSCRNGGTGLVCLHFLGFLSQLIGKQLFLNIERFLYFIFWKLEIFKVCSSYDERRTTIFFPMKNEKSFGEYCFAVMEEQTSYVCNFWIIFLS
jgi:hypothetical protein